MAQYFLRSMCVIIHDDRETTKRLECYDNHHLQWRDYQKGSQDKYLKATADFKNC